jgi:hypothetical protein
MLRFKNKVSPGPLYVSYLESVLAYNVAWCERVASTTRFSKSELVCVVSWGCGTWDTLYLQLTRRYFML